MEDYAAKMQLKSDAALREYVTGHAQYRDEAVLAALAELRQRGQPAPEEAALRPLLEEAVQQQAIQAAQLRERTQAEESEVAEDNLPPLYSPVGIAVISATVSVVAGAVLLALNLVRLKRGRAVVGLVAFVLAYLVGQSLLLKYLLTQHLLMPMSAFLLDLPLIVAYVWWFWPRYVGTYQFRPRNWFTPLAICLLLKFLFLYWLLHNPATSQFIQAQMQQLQQAPR